MIKNSKLRHKIYNVLKGILSGVLTGLIAGTVWRFDFEIYLVLLFLASIMVLLNYDIQSNKDKSLYVGVFFEVHILAFVYEFWRSDALSFNGGIQMLLLFSLLLIGLFIICYGACVSNKEPKEPKLEELFFERKADLERIKKYIKNFNIVTINGDLGTGKTLLMKHLKRQLNSEYYVIRISTLTSNVDDVARFLMDEMDALIKNEGIFTFASLSLRRIFASVPETDFISRFFFDPNLTQTKALEEFRKDTAKLSKKVIIVVEDIDRLPDWQQINKLISITDFFANNSENIKVVYECNVENIRRISLSREESSCCAEKNYIEKYLPNQVNLTPLSFLDIVENLFLINGEHYTEIKIKDIHRVLNANIQIKYKIIFFSPSQFFSEDALKPRVVARFLEDVNFTLKNECTTYLKDNIDIVIVYFFLKYFFKDAYLKLTTHPSSLLEIFRIKKREKNSGAAHQACYFTEDRFINYLLNADSDQVVESLTSIEENKISLWFLTILDYNLLNNVSYMDYWKLNKDIFKVNPASYKMEYKQKFALNLLLYLNHNGATKYTDEEQAVINFIEEILRYPDSEWNERFKGYYARYYNDEYRFVTGNKTIFCLGAPAIHFLFRAMSAMEVAEDDWNKFLDFYFNHRLPVPTSISLELLANLIYIPVEKYRDLYFTSIRLFNSLDVEGNMNRYNLYGQFISKYLSCLSIHGFIETFDIKALDFNIEAASSKEQMRNARLITDIITDFKHQLNDEYSSLEVKELIIELEAINAFIDKNLEVINAEHVLEKPAPGVSVKCSSHMSHEKEYKAIIRCIGNGEFNSDKDFAEYINTEYRCKKLCPYEVKKLAQKYNEATHVEC